MHTQDPARQPDLSLPLRTSLARLLAGTGVRGPAFLALYQAALLGIMVGLLGFTLVGYPPPEQRTIGRLDIYWNSCELFEYCEERIGLFWPANWPELDVHDEGYTLRVKPFEEIDIPRQNKELDTEGLRASLALSRHLGVGTMIHHVQEGVLFGDYIRTIDALAGLDIYPYLRVEEPPSRGFCHHPKGCAPKETAVTVARLVDKGPPVPPCGNERYAVVMRYKEIVSLSPLFSLNYRLDITQPCPEKGWGAEGKPFKKGDAYVLHIEKRPNTFPKDKLVDNFESTLDGNLFIATKIEAPPIPPLR